MIESRQMSMMRTIAVAVAAVMVLAGCTKAVRTPISFVMNKLTIAVPSMVRGQAITDVTLPEAMGGEGALTYSLTPPELPGLMFDPATRVLSGTPTMAGSYSMTYTAMDGTGTGTSLEFTIAVKPTLWGTWHSTYDWYGHEGDEVVGMFVDTLTFTNDRYIQYRAHYWADGTLDHWWGGSGTWDATDSTVVRTWEHNHDDDDETPDVLTSITKDYVLGGEARSILLMHHWSDDFEKESFDRYERVLNPLPSPIIGVWRATAEWDEGPVVFTMTVNADGTLSYQLDELGGTEVLTATWEPDEENYYLNLTDISTTSTPTGGTSEPVNFTDAPRIAYAPTDMPDEILVSNTWSERRRLHGGYWDVFQRQ